VRDYMLTKMSKIGCHVYANDGFEAVKVYKEAFGLDSNAPLLDDGGSLISQELRLNGELFMSVCDKKHMDDVMKKASSNIVNPIMLFTVFFKCKDDLQKAQMCLCISENIFSGIKEPEKGVFYCDIVDKFGVMWHLCVPKDWNSSFIAK